MKRYLVLIGLCLLSMSVLAKPRADAVSWQHNGKNFDGFLIWDDSVKTARPGVLMVPNWYGVNDSAISKAKTLAGKEYVILLVDMYGRGVRPTNPSDAGKASGAVYADPVEMRGRVNAALAQLRAVNSNKAPIDKNKIAAMGFCFGGATVLELARSGAQIDAVASFHGNLSTKQVASAATLKSPLLVMNGADDKFVSAESITAFQSEMQAANADWQFVNFGGAVHCFAEPDEKNAVPGCQYHEPSYKRSVAMMRSFFAERFNAKQKK
jgi:dienelactone hydrolase